MCGRFVHYDPIEALRRAYALDVWPNDDPLHLLGPRYNIAPTDPIATVWLEEDARTLGLLRWGLIPHWQERPDGPPRINARVETVAEKPSFRDAYRTGRAVVPMNGFYEWSDRIPHYITPQGAGPWCFAALRARWRRGEQSTHSVTILTRPPPTGFDLHDRAPVILHHSVADTWLGGLPADELPPTPVLSWHAVDRRVGNVRQDDNGLIAPAKPRGQLALL